MIVCAILGTMYSGADQTRVQTSSLEECQPLGLAKSSLYTYKPSQAKAQSSTGNIQVVSWQCNAKGNFQLHALEHAVGEYQETVNMSGYDLCH